MDEPENPQTLYQAWKGHWPFRQWLYVGITNSPSRRFREHRASSDWMLEAGTIRLTRYPDRESIMEAERSMIRAKRPQYNVQHNRHHVEVEVSPETLAAAGAAICLAILAFRWLADVSSAWWIQRQADRQGVPPIELPPRRNPFTEPSMTLRLFEAFCTVIASPHPVPQPPVTPVPQMPTLPERSPDAAAEPTIGQLSAYPIVTSPPVGGLAATIVALFIMFAQAPTRDQGPGHHGAGNDQEPE